MGQDYLSVQCIYVSILLRETRQFSMIDLSTVTPVRFMSYNARRVKCVSHEEFNILQYKQANCFMLMSCLAYSTVLNVEATYCSESLLLSTDW